MSIAASPKWTAVPQQGYQINSTAISADGSRCILGTSQEYDSGNFSVFCYNSDSNQPVWQDPIGDESYQGVYWVAISGNSQYAAAGGSVGEKDSSKGFLRAYDASNGTILLDESLDSRVNQVAMSDSGEVISAISGNFLNVYCLVSGRFQLTASHTFDTQYCQSGVMSADGRIMVVGTTRSYDGTEGAAGQVVMLEFANNSLSVKTSYDADVGIQRVAITSDGSWWGASRHDGQAMAFNSSVSIPSGTPVWTYAPDNLDLGVAYAFSIAKGTDGNVYAVCGANLYGKAYGCLYAVQSPANTTSATSPTLQWQYTLDYDPNPGLNMDSNATLVTATDGQPESGGKESAGNFYLFDRATGDLEWKFDTTLMNWPMAISANGNAIFGASDNGTAYYWDS
ncbi:PQQ-like beta-propeller repeat protein [Neptunicella marina]|uniref:PQQ-like beta-propeller repeat protein n=1 Tax=Neptunicella marina TaxID=2125989 RepID=A0A8J6IPH5_9ALTE|nr:PQQ-like beta-propeller repeat protein [Neptunicella marina]MBC3765505.1 PQQ-like beta-propeller repeat protein [Neptunicella marina]